MDCNLEGSSQIPDCEVMGQFRIGYHNLYGLSRRYATIFSGISKGKNEEGPREVIRVKALCG